MEGNEGWREEYLSKEIKEMKQRNERSGEKERVVRIFLCKTKENIRERSDREMRKREQCLHEVISTVRERGKGNKEKMTLVKQ